MTASEIQQLIQSDLDSGGIKTALDISKCLVEPTLVDCYDHTEDEPPEKLWLVFQEDPSQEGGYSIVFDESQNCFGLAIPGQSGKRICIGLYGSFLESLNGM